MGRILAQALIAADTILVNIAAMQDGPAGSRTPIQAQFNGDGARIGLDGRPVPGARRLNVVNNGGPAPLFDLTAYQLAQRAGDHARVQMLLADHSRAVERWQQGGNQLLADFLGASVLQWAKDEYGLAEVANGPRPFINPGSVSVKPTYRYNNDPTTFIVQMTPVWGNR